MKGGVDMKVMKPLNSREMMALEMVYALHAKSDEMDRLEARMRECGVWRYYKPAIALLEKAIRAVLNSLPDRNLRHMETVRTKYMVTINPKPIIGSVRSDHIISTKDLQTLCECAMRDKCVVCMNTIEEAKKCPVRDIFLEYAPPNETHHAGLCEYAMMKTPDDDLVIGEDEEA